MPASRYSSRSPAMVLAVMAMIGSARPPAHRTDALRRLDAAHHRHADIHQDEVVGQALHGVNRLHAVADHVHDIARLLQGGHDQPLIDGVVFRDQQAGLAVLGSLGRTLRPRDRSPDGRAAHARRGSPGAAATRRPASPAFPAPPASGRRRRSRARAPAGRRRCRRRRK